MTSPPGSHILQRMNGCDLDEESGEVVGYNQYGYDGEDFIALNLETLMWTAPSSLAFTTKLIWDNDIARLQYNKHYYIKKCPDWLKKYVNYGRSVLQRKGEVALQSETPGSRHVMPPVTSAARMPGGCSQAQDDLLGPEADSLG